MLTPSQSDWWWHGSEDSNFALTYQEKLLHDSVFVCGLSLDGRAALALSPHLSMPIEVVEATVLDVPSWSREQNQLDINLAITYKLNLIRVKINFREQYDINILKPRSYSAPVDKCLTLPFIETNLVYVLVRRMCASLVVGSLRLINDSLKFPRITQPVMRR